MSLMVMEILLENGIRLSAVYAVYLSDEKILAIADLHLGYEASLQVEHVAIPRFQLEAMKTRLGGLLDRYEPEKIIINGDLKHEFSRNIGQEWDEVDELIRYLQETAELIIVRGNHDNYLKTIVSRVGIEMVESYRTVNDQVEFVHGHKYSDNWERFRIFAHEHPFIKLRDDIGALISLPCFLYDKSNNFLLMPAFSPLASGTNVLVTEDNFMIKGLRELNISAAKVYAIGDDGLMDFGEVGKLRSLQENNEIAEEYA
jgi:putative SbcD/Mre11-related phosphoesterase